jgi:hypothetical protein
MSLLIIAARRRPCARCASPTPAIPPARSPRPASLIAAIATLLSLAVMTAPPVAAQPPAAALGKPLPDGTMEAGSISVRVIAGSPSTPVPGTDVTLVVGGQARVMRTNAEGRAVFTGLAVGTSVQARVKDDEGKDISTDSFAVPSSGGVRVMLSTRPMGGGADGAAAPAMAQGMPEAKQMSGQARVDQTTPAGTYVVRLTYNTLSIASNKLVDPEPPVGALVTLVGYVADDSVVVRTAKVDAEGHATFDELDVTGAIAYFALATLPRGTGHDRMFALPVQLDGTSGVRAVLSGERRDSGLPNADQLASQGAIPTPPNQVRVSLEGVASPNTPVKLVDAATGEVVASGVALVLEGDPSTVQGGSRFDSQADLPAGTLDVYVHGGAGGDGPLPEIEIRIVPADTTAPGEAAAVKTATDGTVRVTGIAAGQHRAMFRVLGRDFMSEPFDVAKTGGKLDVRAQWTSEGRPQVLFDVPFKEGQVLYAEAHASGRLAGTFRSLPFQQVPQTGTHVPCIVYPRVLVRFRMHAMVEDRYLAVSGRWQIDNNSWIPYADTPDGMLVPFPRGHTGGLVHESNQQDVAVVPKEGVRVLRPLPPGNSISFIGGFSMPVSGGTVDWALDLPHGAFGSEIQIRKMAEQDSIAVELPPGTRGEVKKGRDGNPYFMIEQITIPPKRSMAMTIRGLPSPSAWKIWAPRIVGLLVLVMMVGGVVFALVTRRPAAEEHAARRARLLDELVQLERSGGDPKRKEQLMAELEKLWGP